MWLHIVSRVLLVICVAIAVAVSMGLIVLRLIGGQLLAVQSNSMQPVFAAGDALIVMPVKQVQVGSIVSYQNPTGDNTTVSHRVIDASKELGVVTTKGDAQKGSSKVSVPDLHITGEAVGVVPNIGVIMTAVRNPIALLCFVYIPATALLIKQFDRLYNHFGQPRYQLLRR